MCRIRFVALMLAALAAPDQVVDGQELPSAPPSAPARLPVRLVAKPVHATAALAAPTADSPLPLKPLQKPSADANGRFRSPSAGNTVTRVVTSLAVVLGLFLLGTLILRKANARGGATLPGEVVQTLGRAPLSGRQEMHLVRVGNKLLLLSVTATGAETLTEITEPEEIDRLAGICRQSHPDSITASFREILWQCGQTQRA
jgi:flagellar biogenesis protein FliO